MVIYTKKTLILYYSWANGNTERIARELQKAMHADIERIDTVKPYTGSYNEVVDQGQREFNSGYKPAIKSLMHNNFLVKRLFRL
jgi:flavodoxin